MDTEGKRGSLYVEGVDDCYALHHLLLHHGIPTEVKRRSSGASPKGSHLIHECENDDSVVEAFKVAVRAGTNQTVGAVLDVDVSLEDRWRSIRNNLSELVISPPIPDNPPAGGLFGESTKFKTTVGVWLMPDNEHEGKLEDFLKTLIAVGDPLIGHAQASTDQAKDDLGATFSEPDRIKAVLHCWLAWQKDPGKPYGVAIKARYFKHDSDAARRFVAWFKRLYGLD